jgi:hypothetical protein
LDEQNPTANALSTQLGERKPNSECTLNPVG